MKRSALTGILCMLLCLLLLANAAVYAAAPTAAAAERSASAGTPAVPAGQSVRYVSTAGAGKKDGTSASNAATSLSTMAKEVGKTGGVVVICGDFSATTSTFGLSVAHPITLTSYYDGVDYRPDATFTVGKNFASSGDLTLEYLNLHASAAFTVSTQFHNLTIGEEMNVTAASGVRYPVLIGGYAESSSSTVAGVSNTRDITVRIKSGKWDTVYCGNYRSAAAQVIGRNDGSTRLIIDGGEFCRTADENFPVSATGMNYQSGDVFMEINGGVFHNTVFAVFRLGTIPTTEGSVAQRCHVGDVLVRINGGTFEKTVGLTRGYASSGNDAYNLNLGVEGNTTFVVNGGTFASPFLVRCAFGDLLLKYDPAKLQANFLDLCGDLPIRQTVDSTAAPDTEHEYVNAVIAASVDHAAGGADPYVIKDPMGDGYYYVYSSGGVKVTKCGNIGLFRQGAVGTSETSGLPSYTAIYNAVRAVSASSYTEEGAPTYQFWAPEMHYFPREVMGDDYGWYIYVAASTTDSDNGHRMYVYRSPERDNPMCTDWEYKGMITDSSNCWAIDGTVIQWQGHAYFAWSGRTTADTSGRSQNIYIASMSNPWTISSSRVLLSTPQYSWERKQTSPAVNEGPQAFVHDGTLYLTYSANGSWAKDYCVGLLTYKGTGSLTDASNWTKRTTGAFFTGTGSAAPYGTGHASITEALDGTPWIVYHANTSTSVPSGSTWWACRRVFAQPLTFDAAMTTNYAVSPSSLNSIPAHNGEYCADAHLLSGEEGSLLPTCGEAGGTFDTCLRCHERVMLTTVSATGEHSYGAWSVTRPATGTANGIETRTCSVCGGEETREIPKLAFRAQLSGASTFAGGEVTVDVIFAENPGLCGARVFLSYDASVLTPVEITYTDLMPGAVQPNPEASPLVLLWADGLHDCNAVGTAARVTFRVAAGFAGSTNVALVSYTADDCLDLAGNGYLCESTPATVTVAAAGDFDADGSLTNADMTALLRALAGWTEPSLSMDLNRDGKIGNRDAVILARKLAGWDD